MTMTERKLVSIRKITDIKPIEGADKIQHYQIDGGWWVVSGINNFKIGDFCLYHEIDSFLPVDRPYYSWLEPKAIEWNGRRGARIKTIRLKGALSQGLALPIKDFTDLNIISETPLDEQLNVVKWEVIEKTQSTIKGNFPNDIPKTDQERIQNIFNKIDRSVTYEITKKMDGSSMTVFFENGKTNICSRNFLLSETDDSHFTKAIKLLGIDKTLEEYGNETYVFQGELIGPGVNGNRHKLSEYEFHVFSVYDRTRKCYLSPSLARRMTQHYRMRYVNVLDTDSPFIFNSIDDALLYAEKVQDGEGVVFKMNREINSSDMALKNFNPSFKIISNKYLLKNDL